MKSEHVVFVLAIVLGLLLAALWYWLDSIRIKEIALATGKAKCQGLGVEFLDESVVLSKLRLRRTPQGHVAVYREFSFEFTSDGERRYSGCLTFLGRHLVALAMDPYRTAVEQQNFLH